MRRLNVFYSVPLLGVLLFVFSVGFPPFDDLTTVNLSVHMLEHVLIIIAGVMVGYPLYKGGFFAKLPRRPTGLAALAFVCVAFAYWHFPGPWDEAVLNPLVHALEHATFFLGGFFIGAFFPMLADRTKTHALTLGFAAHIVYGLALIFQYQIYPLYSIEQQLWLGIWVFMPTPVYLYGIVVYSILSNQGFAAELKEQFGLDVSKMQQSASNFNRSAKRLVPLLSIGLLLTLCVYYGAVGATVVTVTATPHTDTSVVYILESPVTWNYSPQSITVVIGVNNTVSWVSKSISIDTITSQNGLFDSGNIAPGQTYSYTFTAPGVYSYDCIYHPWMVGKVTVVAGR